MTDTDWAARARREAAAILAEAPLRADTIQGYDRLVTLLAASWILGATYGVHEGLEAMGEAFRELKADLA